MFRLQRGMASYGSAQRVMHRNHSSCLKLDSVKGKGEFEEPIKWLYSAMGVVSQNKEIKSVLHHYSPTQCPTFLKLAQERFPFIVL